MAASGGDGLISASILIIVLIAVAIGALVGLALEGVIPGTRSLAVLAGFIATVIASIARYKVVFLGAGAGPDESRVPMVLVINAAIASIAGSLAAHDLVNEVGGSGSSVFLGALAGLFSGVLMVMLMITYHTNPGPLR